MKIQVPIFVWGDLKIVLKCFKRIKYRVKKEMLSHSFNLSVCPYFASFIGKNNFAFRTLFLFLLFYFIFYCHVPLFTNTHFSIE